MKVLYGEYNALDHDQKVSFWWGLAFIWFVFWAGVLAGIVWF